MIKLNLKPIALVVAVALAGCSSNKPTADNYNKYMNVPELKAGSTGSIDEQIANKPAWNDVKVANLVLRRTLEDGSYSPDNKQGILTVTANLINEGKKPVQGYWRCHFVDANGLFLYDADKSNDQIAVQVDGLGWHSMLLYPALSKTQTYRNYEINCKAIDSFATDYRLEFHDTSNNITVYKR
jgi:hypothetical protein